MAMLFAASMYLEIPGAGGAAQGAHGGPGRGQACALFEGRRSGGRRATGEDALKIRALLVDGVLKEWTTGDAHDVTDRSFVVRRAIRINDTLPGRTKLGKPSTGSGSAVHGCWWTV